MLPVTAGPTIVVFFLKAVRVVSAYPAIKASAELTAERFFSTESPEKVVTSVARGAKNESAQGMPC